MKDTSELNFYEMLSYSTTRIECELKGGGKSTGTGFFLGLNDPYQDDKIFRVVIITNKHVVKDAVEGTITLTKVVDGKIANTEHINIPHSNFEDAWIPHPDEDVDLCMMNFKPLELIFRGQGKEFFLFPIPINFIPKDEDILTFDTMEDVIMIGYPNGIWDSYNNKPIFRKGVTATNYGMNYNNQSIFIIDMAVFGGSSGSPVIMSRTVYNEEDGIEKSYRQVFLLGILFAGFQHSASGDIKIMEIPQTQLPYVETLIPNNLGLVIKSEKLWYFWDLFYKPEDETNG